MKRSKLIMIILLAGLIIILVSAIVFLVQERTNNIQAVLQTGSVLQACQTSNQKLKGEIDKFINKRWFELTEDKDTKWWTYQNKIWGYQIQFPNDWYVQEGSEGFLALKDSSGKSSFVFSMPPLGFGYDKNKAIASRINLGPSVIADKFEFDDMTVIEFQRNADEGLISFFYPAEESQQYNQIFQKIIDMIKFIENTK